MIDVILFFSNDLISGGIATLLKDEKDLHIWTMNDISLLDGKERKYPCVLIVDFSVLQNGFSKPHHEAQILLLDTLCGKDNINYAYLSKNVSGVIEGNSDVKKLIKAIRTVSEGKLWISRRNISDLFTDLRKLGNLSRLTQRERDILGRIGKGEDIMEIGRILGIKKETVRSHVEGIKKKCGFREFNEVIRLAELSG